MSKCRTALGAAALVFVSLTARAQTPPDTAGIWTLQEENASLSLASLTDRYYVNGLRIGWTSPANQEPEFAASLTRAIWGDGDHRIAFDLTQQMFTAADTSLVVPDPHDRPYAGILLGNFSLINDTESSRSTMMFSLGVIGPAAGAEQVQNGFHDLIGQAENHGWGHQLANTPAFEVLSERTWRMPLTRFGSLETDLLPSLTGAIGDVRDHVQTGITVRLGQGLNSDFGAPRVRPGLSGGDAYVETRPFAWYVFAGADGQAVAYDITLQSTPFRSGPHVSPVWDVGEMQAGFGLLANGMRFTFLYAAQTQEFQSQRGGLHQFGSASLSLKF